MNELIIGAVISLVVGIIGYFLKRTISRVDKHDTDIEKMREQSVKSEDYKANISELKTDIKQIREDYIMKEDFYRELGKVDRKLDYITDILLQKGGKISG